MKTIGKTTVLHRLRNAEHFQIHWMISHFLVESVVDFMELTTAFALYKQLFEHEDIVFKPRSTMPGTDKIIMADRRRDKEFISLRMTVKSALYSIDSEMREAAEKLMPIIDNYKDTPQKSYNEASAYVRNLTQELVLSEYQTCVEKLSLGSAIELLDNANNAFVALYEKRSNWLSRQKQQGNMKMIRPQVDNAFDILVHIINSLYTTNEVGEQDADRREKLTVMINKINAQLDNVIRTIAYRKSSPPLPNPEDSLESETESNEI